MDRKTLNQLSYRRRFATSKKWIGLLVLALAAACGDSSLVQEAREAENDGRIINNEVMSAMYPASYRAGQPQYLERDFEAGADFICDEIKSTYERDICSEDEINWR